MFLDDFKVLATHLSQYGETKVLEKKIDLVPGWIPSKSRVRPLNPDQKDNLQCKSMSGWSKESLNLQ